MGLQPRLAGVEHAGTSVPISGSRTVKEKSSNSAMTEVFPLDNTDLEPIPCSVQQAFHDQLGANGGHIVDELDEGCCIQAFEAWCEQLGVRFDEIEGINGGLGNGERAEVQTFQEVSIQESNSKAEVTATSVGHTMSVPGVLEMR